MTKTTSLSKVLSTCTLTVTHTKSMMNITLICSLLVMGCVTIKLRHVDNEEAAKLFKTKILQMVNKKIKDGTKPSEIVNKIIYMMQEENKQCLSECDTAGSEVNDCKPECNRLEAVFKDEFGKDCIHNFDSCPQTCSEPCGGEKYKFHVAKTLCHRGCQAIRTVSRSTCLAKDKGEYVSNKIKCEKWLTSD